MEKEKNAAGAAVRAHKIILDNRKVLSISGIAGVDSIDETHAECDVGGSTLSVTGKNIHIQKLDVEQGLLELEGEIECIRYLGEKKNILKRIFK